MKYYLRLTAKWQDEHIEAANKFGYPLTKGYSKLDILESENTQELIDALSSAEMFKMKKTLPHFDEEEYKTARSYLLRNFISPGNFNIIEISDCVELNVTPPVSPKQVFYTTSDFTNRLFINSDKKELFDSFNFKFLDVYCEGKRINSLIYLDISKSSSELKFTDADSYLEIEGESTNLYSNQILDFFPTFQESQTFDIVYTSEIFGWYNHIIISKELATLLVELNVIKWNSFNLIPVRNKIY